MMEAREGSGAITYRCRLPPIRWTLHLNTLFPTWSVTKLTSALPKIT
jgi:hypothetical protein